MEGQRDGEGQRERGRDEGTERDPETVSRGRDGGLREIPEGQREEVGRAQCREEGAVSCSFWRVKNTFETCVQHQTGLGTALSPVFRRKIFSQ